MGIVNLSPDSFSGDGVITIEQAQEQALRFVNEGADILDIGGMSTRPRSEPIAEELESERLARAIAAIRPHTNALISADTYRSSPAEAALEAGADIVNDVSGLRDPNMPGLVARFGAGLITMHMQGEPKTMQQSPHYGDVVAEVYETLDKSTNLARSAGIAREAIMVDPGIGFGKRIEHNLELLRRLREYRSLGYPILIGTSRKGFIGRLTGKEVSDRIPGTAATIALAIANGADVVRVHDVEEMVAVVRVSDAIVRGLSDSYADAAGNR